MSSRKVLLAILCLSVLVAAKTEDQWRTELGPDRYAVMREKQTERGFLGKYVRTTTPGTYACAACRAPLFSSRDKYQIGCGWPTFTKALTPKSVYYLEDWRMPFKRYEVLCRGCDSHLGHVFNDGPAPKGLRYTINSVALSLKPDSLSAQ